MSVSESPPVETLIAESIITPDLWARPPHRPDIDAEIAAMRRLADILESNPAQALQTCCELGLELCGADSCGISVRERTDSGEDIFRWIALAGRLKDHLHGTTPRYNSPCGICVDSGGPLLMQRPELAYKYLDVGPTFDDVLLIPLTEKGSQLEGTIWIVSHSQSHRFDGEDARVMQRLAVFTATALHLTQVAEKAKAEASKQELLFHELDHRVKNTLMMTAGLLRHQLGSIVDPAARLAMESASDRVQAMGRVHEIGSGAASGNLADVIRIISADTVGHDNRFSLKIEAEPVTVPAHKAAVVALIVNELMTNAVKHGLRGRAAGTVAVSLRRTNGNSVTLTVSDDGEPLLANGRNGSGGIGLNLVARLVDQLAGVLSVETEPKRFSVEFPIQAVQQ
jgi:two-component sensor histidine kinase